MRHDAHYVDTLAASAAPPVGRIVPIDRVDPNPDQPRQAMGDLSDLVASLSEKGIIEPLIVRQRGERFQIIAGERRYQAAIRAGILELPVVVRDVDDTEMLELALVENMSYFKCPDCGKVHHIFGKSHAEEIAKKYGIGTYCQLPIDPDLATAVDAGEIEFVMEDGLDPIVEMLKQRTAEEK